MKENKEIVHVLSQYVALFYTVALRKPVAEPQLASRQNMAIHVHKVYIYCRITASIHKRYRMSLAHVFVYI